MNSSKVWLALLAVLVPAAATASATAAARNEPASPLDALDPTPPTLLSFDGLQQLTAVATRQRMLARKLEYTLTVDPQGQPTECEYSYKFRRKAVEIALCRPLLKYMKFNPARDVSGNPVVGTFEGVIDFNMSMGTDGYLVRKDTD